MVVFKMNKTTRKYESIQSTNDSVIQDKVNYNFDSGGKLTQICIDINHKQKNRTVGGHGI
jgi:hypothetical protein